MQTEDNRSPGVIAPPPLICFTLFLADLIPQVAFPVQFLSLPMRWIACLSLVGAGAFLGGRAFQTIRLAKI